MARADPVGQQSVIHHPAFLVEPWALREVELDLERLAQAESVFALANGHVGLRGNLDEGEPYGLLGTYLAGFYEIRPLPYAEAGYGNPEAGQTVVNATDGKIIRLLIEDEPFDIRYGELRGHERVLDFRAGVLRRHVDWVSPSGRSVRVSSTRLVSFTHRAVAAVLYEVEPLDRRIPVVVQSELVANEPLPAGEDDPRVAAALRSPLRAELAASHDVYAALVHSTKASGLTLAAAMDHIIDGPPGTEARSEVLDDLARVTVTADIAPGRPLRLVKFLAYGWSSQRSVPAIRDQVAAALAAARHTGWHGLLNEQRTYLDEFWERADVELDGDSEVQQAVRFGLFHTLQASARSEQRAIAAKGLTGPGYDGHTFWDTESFVLPVLTYTAPHVVADALRWRHLTLELAKQRARQLGLRGAAFPWRTIRGQECSGYWPAGTAAFHINADIADAVVRYQAATGDDDFERQIGLELLVETARLWRSLGHYDAAGRFRIDGVPDPTSTARSLTTTSTPTSWPSATSVPPLTAPRIIRGGRPNSASITTRRPAGATPPGRCFFHTTRRWASTRRRRDSSSTRHGTSARPRPNSTRCCCTSRTSTCIAKRSSNRLISCSRCICAAMPSPRSRRPATSSTTSR